MKFGKQEKELRQLLGSREYWRRIAFFVLMVVVLEVISAIQYYNTHNLLEDEMERHAMTELGVKTLTLRQTMNSAEQLLKDQLWNLERNLHQPDSMFGVVQHMVQVKDNVVGACLAFVPDFYPEKGRLFEPYAYEVGDTVKVEQLGGKDGHDYTLHPAYQWVAKHHEKIWSDPYKYESEVGMQSLTSFSYPLLDADGNLEAVCGLDVSLLWLGDALNTRHAYPSSFTLFLTQKGELIAGPTSVSKERQQRIVELINDSTSLH